MIQDEVRAARTVTAGQISQAAQAKPDVRRSPLFVWMSENQVEFERLVAGGHTWQALADSFTEHGILAKGGLRVTARTARKTWYRVRLAFGGLIQPPIERAELSKIARRRKPRSNRIAVPTPEPRSDEVAHGVRDLGRRAVNAIAEGEVVAAFPTPEPLPSGSGATNLERAIERLASKQKWMHGTKG